MSSLIEGLPLLHTTGPVSPTQQEGVIGTVMHGDRDIDMDTIGPFEPSLEGDMLHLPLIGGGDIHGEPVGEHTLIGVDEHRVSVDSDQFVDSSTEQRARRSIHHQDSPGRVDLHHRLGKGVEQMSRWIARPASEFAVARPPSEGQHEQDRRSRDRRSDRHLIGDDEPQGRRNRGRHPRPTTPVTRSAPRTTRRDAP